jgi:murein DD-endopeptidase MepM/ murein hydrolase activator NlpD
MTQILLKIYKLALLSIIIILFFENLQAQKSSKSDIQKQNDSIINEDNQDVLFQDYLDTIFHNDSLNVNLNNGWDNKMINSGHFDSQNMKDTIFFMVSDPLTHESFYPPFKNYVTCGFGYRRSLFHFGTDIKLQKGDTIRAAFDGLVRVTKFDRHGFGNVVVIRHEKGLETIYGHMSKVLVNTNQVVKAGDIIGLGGNTGRSTGSHLHFEMRYMGEPFDPSCFYDFNNNKLLTDTLVLTKSNFEYLIDIRKARYCVIRRGDTLARISRNYHIPVSTLCRLNNITSKTILRVGRKLRYN